jgi:hypothetical protein
VNNVNIGLPIANAGLDQTVDEGVQVTLDGSGSSDTAPGTVTGYSWTQTDGPIVTLDNTIPSRPTFTAPSVTTTTNLIFELIVTDNEGGVSAPDTVTIKVNNVNAGIPIADAGTNQVVDEGDVVTLDGSGSSDTAPGTVTGYSWTQTDATGITVNLTGATTVTPSFTAPSVSATTDLIFSLSVTDNDGAPSTVADTVTITVNNVNAGIPIADAGTNQVVDEGDVVTLDGSGSSDTAPGTVTGYSWTQTTGPSVTNLTGATTSTPSFTAPSVSATTDLIFSLSVTDNDGGVSTVADTVTITVNNVNTGIPIANAGPDQTVNEDAPVTLDGSGSSDTAPGTVTGYSWTQIAGPNVTNLTGATTVAPSFTAPSVSATTDLIFSLSVTDNDGAPSTAVDTVTITVNNVNVLMAVVRAIPRRAR